MPIKGINIDRRKNIFILNKKLVFILNLFKDKKMVRRWLTEVATINSFFKEIVTYIMRFTLNSSWIFNHRLSHHLVFEMVSYLHFSVRVQGMLFQQ